MMKVQLLAAGAALCAFAMASCTNETDEVGTQDGIKQTKMTMQVSAAPQTRADYTTDGTDGAKMNFSWRAKDELSVVINGVSGNENCQLSTKEVGKSAPFSGKVAMFSDSKTIYAFYPYSTTPFVVTGGDNKETATAAITLPTTQLYTIDGAISNSFMVGIGTATASGTDITSSVGLKQVMSIIKLNITNAPAKVKSVRLKCAEAIFATTATVKLSDATITNPDTFVKVLSMAVTDNSVDNTGTKSISFAIFPKAKVDGMKIQIEVTYDDGKWNMIEKNDIDFVRNMHYVVAFDGTLAVNNYVVVDNLKIAIGNLVADGEHGARIGAATDGGLYFQFGSLIGWAGGASGDGTGMPASNTPGYSYNGAGAVVPSGKTLPTTYGDPNRWNGNMGNVPSANDACTKYLGSGWRLPTRDEYVKLFENNGFPSIGPWKLDGFSATNSILGLTFNFTGLRTSGSTLSFLEQACYCWCSTQSDVSNGHRLYISTLKIEPNSSYYREHGLPVRCVQTISK